MSVGFYNLTNLCTRFLFLPPYGTLSVRGTENVPLEGPLVIASNHLNDADPAIIASRFPRTIVYMAKIELFSYPVIKQFMEAYGAIPVRRGEADLSALRRAAEELSKGMAVCIFPEGTRSGEKAALMEAWPGAGLLALRSGAPVLPIAITGTENMPLPGMFFEPHKRKKVEIVIGKPFNLEKPVRVNGEAAKTATDTIMRHIAALLPPSYRGYYGEQVANAAE